MCSFRGVAVDAGIGPFSERGLDEALGLSVGAGRIGACAFRLDTEVLAGAAETMSLVAWTVVGQDAADADAKPSVPGDGGVEEVGRRGLGLVRVHGGEGDAGVVVDGDVQELGPDAPDRIAAVTGNTMGWPFDLDQAFDIEVQQVARSRVFIADDRGLRLQIADAVKLQPAQDAADRGRADLQLQRDPYACPALPAQPLHAGCQFVRRPPRAVAGTAGAVSHPSHALQPIAPNPLGCGLPAEPALGCRLAQTQPALHNALC